MRPRLPPPPAKQRGAGFPWRAAHRTSGCFVIWSNVLRDQALDLVAQVSCARDVVYAMGSHTAGLLNHTPEPSVVIPSWIICTPPSRIQPNESSRQSLSGMRDASILRSWGATSKLAATGNEQNQLGVLI